MRIYNSLHYSSVNIAFKRDKITNLKFNIDFGANAKYSNGEDTLFIVAMLRNNLKIYSSPINIGRTTSNKSTWFKGYNEKFFFDKGALFTAVSKRFRLILMLQYLLRHKEILNNIKFSEAFNIMLKGSRDYLNHI